MIKCGRCKEVAEWTVREKSGEHVNVCGMCFLFSGDDEPSE